MSLDRRRALPTPRLLVVGLVVLGAACHRKQQPVASAPPPASAPKPQPSAPAAPPPTSSAIATGASLVRAMHDRYGSAFRNITFVQKTTVSLSSGSQVVQTWYVAGDPPGRWRVETDANAKGGIIYLGDSTYQFAAGKLAKADTGANEILAVAFDVYAHQPARSEAMLRRLGFDLTRFHEGTWRGMQVYVIGAARGDTTSKQLWVDRDRMLPIRLLENTRQGRADFRFGGYVQSGAGWVPTEVEQYVGGKRRLLEQFTQVRTNVSLPEALFDPRRWATAPRWTP